jgi:hypothetical protein
VEGKPHGTRTPAAPGERLRRWAVPRASVPRVRREAGERAGREQRRRGVRRRRGGDETSEQERPREHGGGQPAGSSYSPLRTLWMAAARQMANHRYLRQQREVRDWRHRDTGGWCVAGVGPGQGPRHVRVQISLRGYFGIRPETIRQDVCHYIPSRGSVLSQCVELARSICAKSSAEETRHFASLWQRMTGPCVCLIGSTTPVSNA